MNFNRRRDVCFLVLALLFLAAVPLATLLKPQVEVSQIENRKLAQTPTFSAPSLVSGEYFLAWEDWLKDHIAFRDGQIMVNTWLDLKLFGRTEVNGILRTDEVLLPQLSAESVHRASADEVAATADALAKLQAQISRYGGTFLYVGVPTQMTAWHDRFPAGAYSGAEVRDANAAAFATALTSRGIPFLDMRTVFAANGGTQAYYMRTDHHYNLKGAFLVYRAIGKYLQDNICEIPVLTENDLTFSALDLQFLGSRNRAIYYLSDLTDPVYVAELKQPIAFTRTDNGAESAPVVYHTDKAVDGKISYGLYMGGDIAETVITTDRTDLPTVLLFGDSYTNAVETFLYTGFSEMRVLDLRHYNKMPLSAYIETHQPDIVICLRDDSSYLVTSGNGNIR